MNFTRLISRFLTIILVFAFVGCQMLVNILGSNEPPNADAGGDLTGVAGEELTFDGGASSDPDGEIISFEWDFGDDGTGTGETITHTYDTGGEYEVTLIVSDDEGATGTDSMTVTVNGPPTADAGGDQTVLVNEEVSFDASGSTDDGIIQTFEWDFDDGTTGSGETITHTYDATGTYEVQLTVSDDQGATSADTVAITVDPILAVAQMQATQTTATIHDTIYFDGRGSHGGTDEASIQTYEWDFENDGTVDRSTPTATHSYSEPGTHEVSLLVVDASDHNDTAYLTVEVENQLPDASIDVQDLSGTNSYSSGDTVDIATTDGDGDDTQLSLDFDASASSDAETMAAGLTFSWDSNNDGVEDSDAVSDTFAYTSTGTYLITVTVTDEHGDVDTKECVLYVVDDSTGTVEGNIW